MHEQAFPSAVGSQRAATTYDSHSYSSASPPLGFSDRRPPPVALTASGYVFPQPEAVYHYGTPYPRKDIPNSGPYYEPYGHGADGAGATTNTNRHTPSVSSSGGRVPLYPPSSFIHHNRVSGADISAPRFVSNNYLHPSDLFSSSLDNEPLLPSQYSSAAHVPHSSSPSLPHAPQPLSLVTQRAAAAPKPSPSRSTLWWGELEAWMDEEYAKQVCSLMGWESVTVKIPHTVPDPLTGQQANNPGYCFLTFPSPAQAASVLSQVNNPSASGAAIMPNSTKPFTLNWASSPSPSPASASFTALSPVAAPVGLNLPQKEYSIFVGDLAPETSNSDLVSVFRNPVLGLRNDRAPKFIRPFYSCKSAKIMLDPATGVSRGYGFVRFVLVHDKCDVRS